MSKFEPEKMGIASLHFYGYDGEVYPRLIFVDGKEVFRAIAEVTVKVSLYLTDNDKIEVPLKRQESGRDFLIFDIHDFGEPEQSTVILGHLPPQECRFLPSYIDVMRYLNTSQVLEGGI